MCRLDVAIEAHLMIPLRPRPLRRPQPIAVLLHHGHHHQLLARRPRLLTAAFELPRVELAHVPAVEQHAEALVRGDEVDRAEPKGQGAEDAPPARAVAEGQEHGHDDRAREHGDGEGAEEEHARLVAVADGPAHEVGVGLVFERDEEGFDDGLEDGWVRRVLQGLEELRACLVGEVEFSRGGGMDVVAEDLGDFGAEGLDAD